MSGLAVRDFDAEVVAPPEDNTSIQNRTKITFFVDNLNNQEVFVGEFQKAKFALNGSLDTMGIVFWLLNLVQVFRGLFKKSKN